MLGLIASLEQLEISFFRRVSALPRSFYTQLKIMSKWESNADTRKMTIAAWRYSTFVNLSCAWPKHLWKRSELVRNSASKSPHGAEPIRIRLALSVHLSANSYSIVQIDIIIQFILDD